MSNRDTGLRLIEKIPQDIYIQAQRWNTTIRREQIKSSKAPHREDFASQ